MFSSAFIILEFLCFYPFSAFLLSESFYLVIALIHTTVLPSSGYISLPPFPHLYLHLYDFFFCFIYFRPTIPLGHQPGSLLHQQCHPFLCKSWCLHTKLPICTLPALCCLHGSCGPEEHAPAAGGSTALRCPARPLPAGAHSLPTRFPR